MSILLSPVHHVLADALQLLVDFARTDHIGVERLSQGCGQRADHAAVDEAVGALLARRAVGVAHQVVVQGRRVEQGLEKKKWERKRISASMNVGISVQIMQLWMKPFKLCLQTECWALPIRACTWKRARESKL